MAEDLKFEGEILAVNQKGPHYYVCVEITEKRTQLGYSSIVTLPVSKEFYEECSKRMYPPTSDPRPLEKMLIAGALSFKH